MTIRPLPVVTAEVDSEMGELQDLLGSAEVAGLGQRSLARLLGPHVRVAADAAPHILGYIVAWALLTLAWHVGHLWWPSRRKFRRFGRQNGVDRAQNSRVFRDAPIGLGLRW